MVDFIASVPPDLLAAVGSLLMLGFVKLARITKLDTRILVGIATGFIAFAWVGITNYVPLETQEAVTSFASKAFVIQWALYEGWKKITGGGN